MQYYLCMENHFEKVSVDVKEPYCDLFLCNKDLTWFLSFLSRWERCGVNSSQNLGVSSAPTTDWNPRSETYAHTRWRGGTLPPIRKNKLQNKKLRELKQKKKRSIMYKHDALYVSFNEMFLQGARKSITLSPTETTTTKKSSKALFYKGCKRATVYPHIPTHLLKHLFIPCKVLHTTIVGTHWEGQKVWLYSRVGLFSISRHWGCSHRYWITLDQCIFDTDRRLKGCVAAYFVFFKDSCF